jgi:hypothetical protein
MEILTQTAGSTAYRFWANPVDFSIMAIELKHLTEAT